MGLLSTEVEIVLAGKNIKYFESLGYEIPRYYNKTSYKWMIKTGTKILVKVSDILPNSKVLVNIECDLCDKKYRTQYSNYLRNLHEDGCIYCVRCACKLFKSGDRHCRWNPNKTDEERLMGRVSSEYNDFIRKVFKRDNYTCQCCGITNCQLKAHHLDGFNWCEEKRTDPNNGITLCEICHKNFHAIYGKGDNTKEQFEEWIGRAVCLLEQNIPLLPARQIYCIEEDRIYPSATELANQWKISSDSPVYDVCNHREKLRKEKTKDGSIKTRTVRCCTVKGKHLLWYDEYVNMTSEELEKYVLENNYVPYKRKIICVTTGQVFDSIRDAQNHYNIRNVCECCRSKGKHSGKLEDGTPLEWRYYEDYLKEHNLTIQEVKSLANIDSNYEDTSYTEDM